MNILFISNEYPPDTGFGGIATYSRYAAEGLAMRGNNVQVICRSIGSVDCTALENGVRIHRVVPGPYPLPRTRLFFLLRKLCYGAIPQSLVRLAWARTVAQTCSRLVKEGGFFDIIEYPECGAEGYCLARKECLRRCVLVARLHTPWEIIHSLDKLKEPFFDALLQSYIERKSARRASAVSAPSQAIAQRLMKPWRLKTVKVYPNPLPAADYSLSSGNEWVYIGRIERRKGTHLLIKAYATVCAKRSPPPLRLVGRPYGCMPCGRPYGDYISELIRESGMRERIAWTEGVPHGSIREFLGRSAVAFFPSLWENFSYACLEAMASGCAVVASDCGGYPEMITHDKNGLLFEPGNVLALADAMYRIIDQDGLAGRLGREAGRYVREYCDQSIICALAEDFYRSLLERQDHG